MGVAGVVGRTQGDPGNRNGECAGRVKRPGGAAGGGRTWACPQSSPESAPRSQSAAGAARTLVPSGTQPGGRAGSLAPGVLSRHYAPRLRPCPGSLLGQLCARSPESCLMRRSWGAGGGMSKRDSRDLVSGGSHVGGAVVCGVPSLSFFFRGRPFSLECSKCSRSRV